MKPAILAVSAASLFFFVGAVHAQTSTTSPKAIGFFCPPYTESFVEGGFYEVPTTTPSCTFQTEELPAGRHYGGLFRGVVGNSTGGGNSMGLSTDRNLNLTSTPFVPDPEQDEPYFAAVWEIRTGPAFANDLQDFLNFFRDGSNPPPHSNWGAINWHWGETPPEECCSSVMFLPGIKGSILKSGSDTLWPPTIFSDDVPQLALDEATGESVNSVYVDGIVETVSIGPFNSDVYAPFVDFIDAFVIDNTINDWLPLAYDWRFSPEQILEDGIRTNSGIEDVIAKIEELASQSQTKQVTIVAHSMGGLLGKAIIKSLEDEGKDDLIDSFVMIGVPQLGTPQAAGALLHGDDEGLPSWGGFIASPVAVRTVAQNMQSAYDLLPSPHYFDDVPDPVISFDPASAFTNPWIALWGNFINEYNDFAAFVTGTGAPRTKPPENLLREPEVLRTDLMAHAADFHNEYDNYAFPEHIRVVQVAGWGLPTTKATEYKESHGFPSYKTLFTVEGDKTVVYPSAISSIADEIYFFDLASFNALENTPDFQHGDLLSSSQVQSMIETIIEEQDVSETTYVLKTKPNPGNIAERLIVSVHSPVLLGAYDEFGNFTGVDLNQDLSADILTITEDIPRSTFLYTSESQYIFLPKVGVYTFIYKGIGEGETTVEIQSFVADTTTPIVNYSDILTTQSTTATFIIDSSVPEETVIELDLDGDEQTDKTIYPDGTTSLSLEELLTLLKEYVLGLNVPGYVKHMLSVRIEHVDRMIEHEKSKDAQLLTAIKTTVNAWNGYLLNTEDAEQLLAELERLEEYIQSAPLNVEALAEFKDLIQSLDVRGYIKSALLQRVNQLDETRTLDAALANLVRQIEQQERAGRISGEEAQELLTILEEIESAL